MSAACKRDLHVTGGGQAAYQPSHGVSFARPFASEQPIDGGHRRHSLSAIEDGSFRQRARRRVHAEFRRAGLGREEDQGASATRGSSGIAQDLSTARLLCVFVGGACLLARTYRPVRWV